MQQSWYQRLAPVLEWSFITRSHLPLMALVAVWVFHYSWATLAVFVIDGGDQAFSHDHFVAYAPMCQLILLGAVPIFVLGEILRKAHREPLWYQHLTANYYGLTLVWGGYISGGMNFASGVVLMGAPLIGFLFLERRVVWIAFAVSFAALIALNYASAYGLLPYAPMVLIPQDHSNAYYWVLCQMMMATPHMAFEIAFTAVVVGQWRLRETAVLTQSLTDVLTGLHNRRSILKQLLHELARAKRKGTPLSLLLFDLDHFKQINDNYGHPAGDAVLKHAAEIIKKEVRTSDCFGRFGGEEFILLLPATDIDTAQLIAERCRKNLHAALATIDSGEQVQINASFGVSWIDAGCASNEKTLIADADEALYRAKENGRNRIELASGPSNVFVAYDDMDHQRHWALPNIRFDWRTLLSVASVRNILISLLEWTPVNKARMVGGLTLYILSTIYLWLTYLYFTDSAGERLNADAALFYFKWAPLILGSNIFLFTIGAYVNQLNPNSRWYIILTVNLFALVLVWVGYGIGLMAMPTGIVMLATPIIGFLLFDRATILQPLILAQVLVVALAFLSTDGTVPYAPLLSPQGTVWHPETPFLVTTHYLASSLIMMIAFVLIDHMLSRWRTREDEVRQLNITDMLTRLHNRRSILDLLNAARDQAARQQQPLSIVMLDLDHFKSINDAWGHPMGDKVLKATAKAILECLRDSDVAGRFGGEEFLLVLPDTDAAGATLLAERCREKIENLALSSKGNSNVAVSASFGISDSNVHHALTAVQLIKNADNALYAAKAQGRNRVVIARQENCSGDNASFA